MDLMFILMGSFTGRSVHAVDGRAGAKQALKTLLDTIQLYPFLAQNARFLIVPGPGDVGACGHIAPRKPVPECFIHDYTSTRGGSTSGSRGSIRHLTFASNPCRLRFYTQEIVVFREDLLRRFQKHSLLQELCKRSRQAALSEQEEETVSHKARQSVSMIGEDDDGADETEDVDMSYSSRDPAAARSARAKDYDATYLLASTLVHQAHLCPLPAQLKPVHWELDHTLRLSPLPHLVRQLLPCLNILLFNKRIQYITHVYIHVCRFSWAIRRTSTRARYATARSSIQVHYTIPAYIHSLYIFIYIHSYITCVYIIGSFSTDYSFVVYRPSSGDVELSSV